MLSQSVVQIHDSSKSLRALVTGFIQPKDNSTLEILDLHNLSGGPKGLRLDSVIWLIEEKAGLRLYWGDTLMLPMESRNSLRLDTPLNSPSNWDGKLVLAAGKTEEYLKAFFLHLDFDKQ
jgi:hypothetical protein